MSWFQSREWQSWVTHWLRGRQAETRPDCQGSKMMRGSPAAIGQLQWINGPFAHLHENVSDFIGRIKQFLRVSKASVNEPVVCALSWSENADNGQHRNDGPQQCGSDLPGSFFPGSWHDISSTQGEQTTTAITMT